MSKAASPQRGLFSWLTGPRPLSSTDVPDRQLPDPVGGTATRFVLLLFLPLYSGRVERTIHPTIPRWVLYSLPTVSRKAAAAGPRPTGAWVLRPLFWPGGSTTASLWAQAKPVLEQAHLVTTEAK